MLLESFPPCVAPDARVLILGSMPGRASLDEAQYYAHPRNVFWPLIADILSSDLPAAYQAKLPWLTRHKIALWDVLKHCEREGSLDSKIDTRTEVPNALPELIAQLPNLHAVLFNGKKAEQAFRVHCRDVYDSKQLKCVCLPSTSPANAAMSRARKVEIWASAILPLLAEAESRRNLAE